jgi:hypothetical protein
MEKGSREVGGSRQCLTLNLQATSEPFHKLLSSAQSLPFFFFFKTLGLKLVRPVLYHFSHTPSFCLRWGPAI